MERQQRSINRFFNTVELICERAPALHRLIVELGLLGLLLLGLWHVFKWTT
jgi:hypothetical protein